MTPKRCREAVTPVGNYVWLDYADTSADQGGFAKAGRGGDEGKLAVQALV